MAESIHRQPGEEVRRSLSASAPPPPPPTFYDWGSPHPPPPTLPRQRTLRSTPTLPPPFPPATEAKQPDVYPPLTRKLIPLSSELAREKMWSRIYITPLLQAEEDRDQARRYFADQAREKELFGSTSRPYNSDRYESLRFLPAGYISGGGAGEDCCCALGGKMKMENEWVLLIR